MKSRKGYTIIELITVIAILGILSMAFINYSHSYKKYKDRILNDSCANSILNFIITCKQYCYYHNAFGYIEFDLENDKMNFYSEGRARKNLKLAKGFDLYSITISEKNKWLEFDNKGFTSDAGTIIYKDLAKNPHSITVSVGTSYVEIKS